MASDDDIFAAIDKADPTLSRSRLSQWMRQNHDALDRRLRGHRTVWSKLVSVFVEQGLTDANGNPPNAETARKTWQRIKREVRQGREAGLSSMEAGPALRQPTPPAAQSDDEPDDLPPREDFRPAKLR